jgi:peptidoglycan/LPS O-acetylase OafA/YrhL
VTRYRFLDGLRGWAAVGVLFYHVFVDALPPNELLADRTLWARVFCLNGTLAVCIFFVVSGFSLSVRYIETGDARGLVRIAAGRYLRLAIPIFAICALAHALMITGLIPPAGQRPPPLDVFLRFEPTFGGLFSFSLFKVFFAYSGAETYDPPLWTMSYELIGSFLVFTIAAVARDSRMRVTLLGVLFLGLASAESFYALFVGGILLADLRRPFVKWRFAIPAGLLVCATGLALSLFLTPWFGLPYIAVAMLLTAGVACCRPVTAMFENRLSNWLGTISYPLYLVQAVVIYSFSLWLLGITAAPNFDAVAQRWIVGWLTIPAALLAAIAFVPINELAVTLSRKFGAAALSWSAHLTPLVVRRRGA